MRRSRHQRFFSCKNDYFANKIRSQHVVECEEKTSSLVNMAHNYLLPINCFLIFFNSKILICKFPLDCPHFFFTMNHNVQHIIKSVSLKIAHANKAINKKKEFCIHFFFVVFSDVRNTHKSL